MAIIGFIAVACIAVVAFVIATASSVGAFEILMISVFGFGAIVAMIIFSTFAMGKWGARKVKKGVAGVKNSIAKFKRN